MYPIYVYQNQHFDAVKMTDFEWRYVLHLASQQPEIVVVKT